MDAPGITGEEKRATLTRVLESRTFGRSEQLRAFLRYVCEAEFEGRADQLNEYALGVSVLGRRAGYSPAEDSTVRSRAYDLRNKLKSYYRDEAPGDPIAIVIEKGAYVPRFVRRLPTPEVPSSLGMAIVAPADEAPQAPSIEDLPVSEEPVAAASSSGASTIRARSRGELHRERARPWGGLGLAMMASGLVLLVISASLFWRSRTQVPAGELAAQTPSPQMQRFWGPFLDGSAPVLVSFHTRLFFFSPQAGLVIRDYRTNEVGQLPSSKPLEDFRARMAADTLVETYDYSDVGAVRAAFLLGRLLDPEATLKDSRTLDWEDLWNSHVIFVGKAADNAAIHKILLDADLDFVDAESGSIVRNLRPAPGELAEYPNAATHGLGTKYGVITVLPGPQVGHRLLLLTASAAELEGALAHAVTDPTRVAEIVSHVQGPEGTWPSAFQVLMEVTLASNVPTNIRYVTHRVYEPPRSPRG